MNNTVFCPISEPHLHCYARHSTKPPSDFGLPEGFPTKLLDSGGPIRTRFAFCMACGRGSTTYVDDWQVVNGKLFLRCDWDGFLVEASQMATSDVCLFHLFGFASMEEMAAHQLENVGHFMPTWRHK